jgi:tetratricopeptide (TPR) repeat protein
LNTSMLWTACCAVAPSEPSRARVQDFDESIAWFERALALDLASSEAQARLATALAGRVQDFVPESSHSDLERAEMLARQAVMSSPRGALMHYAMAEMLRTRRRYIEAISEYETVLALDRNFTDALADLGRCKTYIGPVDDAIPAPQQAIRLSPRDPRLFNWYFRIDEAHLLQSRFGQAVDWLRKVTERQPFDLVCARLASRRLRPQGRSRACPRGACRSNDTSGNWVRARR